MAQAVATRPSGPGALMQWLGDAIQIQTLSVTTQDSEALVTLTYVVSHTQQVVNQTITQGLGA